MSMTLTQENRMLSINTPLGADTLLLTGFSGSEGISMPFSFELSLASEDTNINPRDIIGQGVTISIGLADDERRSINGIVCRFSQERLGEGSDQFLHVATYSATVVPWLWVLTRTLNSRIFQEKTVQQIIEQIFSDRGFPDFEFRLSGKYEPREYCVQYREIGFQLHLAAFGAGGHLLLLRARGRQGMSWCWPIPHRSIRTAPTRIPSAASRQATPP